MRMIVNLLNDYDLNRYLGDIVWDGDDMPIILNGGSQQKLTDIKYIKNNTDTIARMIVFQYIKHRARTYLTSHTDTTFLTRVTIRPDLPEWAIRALNNGTPVYEFHSNKVTDEIRHDLISVRDYMYAMAHDYINETIARATRTDGTPKIRLDFLKTNNKYTTFTDVLNFAHTWHKTHKPIHNATNDSGAEFIMHLGEILSAYKLTTPSALDFESAQMGHCVGWGGYDARVARGKTLIYSIRDTSGKPHATIEVKNNTVHQCKGHGDQPPIQKYIPAIQQFIIAHGFDVPYELRHTGLIKRDNKYYSVFKLPDGFVIDGDLNLSGLDLTGANLNICVQGRLNVSNTTNLKLPATLDFSATSDVMMMGVDFTGVKNIVWSPKSAQLARTKNLPPVLDFSNTEIVDLNGADLLGVMEIKYPRKFISIAHCTNVSPSIMASYNAYKLRGGAQTLRTNAKNTPQSIIVPEHNRD